MIVASFMESDSIDLKQLGVTKDQEDVKASHNSIRILQTSGSL